MAIDELITCVYVGQDPLCVSFIRVYCEEGFQMESEALKPYPCWLSSHVKLTEDIFIVFATLYFHESYYVICPIANLNKTISLDIAAFEF